MENRNLNPGCSRYCERRNYTPHSTPNNSNRIIWHDAYALNLLEMYDIVANTIDELYPKNNIQWAENGKIANNLSKMIYHCSSKYISPYI